MSISSITFVFRKKNPLFYSIERVFNQVIAAWPFSEILTVISLPDFGLSFSNLLFLRKRTRAQSDTIFHVTGDAHYVVFVLPRKHTLLTIHDCVFIQQHNGLKKWVLKKVLLDWPVRYLQYISTISEKTKEEIVKLTNCDPGKITVIPNPVSADIYFADKVFNDNCPTLLFIGSTPNKNLERVAEALHNINCRLLIIGKPTETQIDLLSNLNIRYEYKSGLSDKEVADRYAESDIILFPSLYEGFGLPVIEGFKAGRVVITSNISPLKELAGNAACLVDPYNKNSIRDSILKVMNDRLFRNDLIKRGLEKSAGFEAGVIAGKYYQLYKRMQ